MIPFTEPQKRKNPIPRQTGCWKLLLIPILMAVACYGGMWGFARYGGNLAMSYLPVPPDSRLTKTIYEERDYIFETALYFHPLSPEQVREWYTQHRIWMSPGKSWDYSNYPIYRDYEDFYGTDDPLLNEYREDRPIPFLYTLSVSLTSSWRGRGGGWCDHVYIYKNEESFAKYYPDITLPAGVSAFEVATCWRNVK